MTGETEMSLAVARRKRSTGYHV